MSRQSSASTWKTYAFARRPRGRLHPTRAPLAPVKAELARLLVQAKLEKEREKTLRVQMLARATVERAQQKAAAHLGRTDLTVGALKNALRVAVRGLVTGRTAEAVSLLGADNETAPYLNPSFWEAEGTKSATESEGT